jgi:hypothetical protein
VLGEIVRSRDLVGYAFGFLENEFRFSGLWTSGILQDSLETCHDMCRVAPSEVVSTVRTARDPEEVARFFMIQVAGDYLTEVSAMAQMVLGYYMRTGCRIIARAL